MKKKIKRIFAIVIVILLALVICLTLWLPSFVMKGKRQTLREAFKWQSDHYDTSFYKTLKKKDYTVKGDQGYVLHVELLKNPKVSYKYIILSHGYTDNRMGSLKYVKMYLQLGYNCIIYDLRGHGENASTITTYGMREGKDLNALIKDTRKRYSDLTVLGLHGESLGAATTISSLQYKPDVDFVVSDCGFADIENVLKDGYRKAHVPVFLVDLADVGARLRYHVSIKKMRPIEALKNNQVPILFIHGQDDAFIDSSNSKRMADADSGYHEYYEIPTAGHAESIFVAPKDYQKYVSGFLKKVVTK